MANPIIKHASLTGAAANPDVLVDGPKWDADHTVAGLENVDNTSDANKPVSTAQQTALNGKADIDANGSLKINGDVVLSHPITPTPDNDAGTNITLGKGAGAALAPIHSTQYATFVGFQAGNSQATGDHNTAIGAWALASYNVAGYGGNTAIGIDSLRSLTSGTQNVGVGEHTLTQATSASGCTSFGYGAGFNIGGNYNTFFGYSAGQGVVGSIGDYNVAFGPFSLVQIQGVANGNIGVGAFAGNNITTGVNNIALGRQAATTLTTGSGNILIGTLADVPAVGTNNYLNIGGTIKGTLGGQVQIAGFFHVGGQAKTVNFNSVADTAITITCPTTTYRIQGVYIVNNGTTAALNVAQFGIFSSTGGGGTAIIASATSMGAITSNAVNTATSAQNFSPSISAPFNYTTIYFRITTAQGAAASGDVYVIIQPLG